MSIAEIEEYIKNNVFSMIKASKRKIERFSLLWMAFEAEHLNNNGNQTGLSNYAQNFNFNNFDLGQHINRFRKRYYGDDREYPEHLILGNGGLRFKGSPAKREHLKDSFLTILKYEEQAENVETLDLLLNIIYRYRNNLHHGEKYMMEDAQHLDENFDNANLLLFALLKHPQQ